MEELHNAIDDRELSKKVKDYCSKVLGMLRNSHIDIIIIGVNYTKLVHSAYCVLKMCCTQIKKCGELQIVYKGKFKISDLISLSVSRCESFVVSMHLIVLLM